MLSFGTVSTATVKNYWDARPCNIRHSQRPLGTRQYFDEVETRKYFVEPHIPAFADFSSWQGKRVLEIGCGIGTDTINFARHGAEITAVDLSARSIEIAQQRAELFGVAGRIQFYCGDSEKLTSFLPLSRYDLIYSFGVIHHTPNPERVIEQIREYAKPGCRVKLMVYHRHSWKVLWILLSYGTGRFWRMSELVARYSEAQTGCPVTYTYSKSEACRLLEDQGFRVNDIRVDHIFPYRIADYVRYRYKKVWYFRFLPLSLFRTLERRFGWHLLIDAIVR